MPARIASYVRYARRASAPDMHTPVISGNTGHGVSTAAWNTTLGKKLKNMRTIVLAGLAELFCPVQGHSLSGNQNGRSNACYVIVATLLTSIFSTISTNGVKNDTSVDRG